MNAKESITKPRALYSSRDVDPRREVAMLKKVVAGIVILIVVAMAVVFLIARHMLGSENVRATLERELSSRLGQPVTIGSANASIFPKVTLHLRDIAIGRPVAATLKDVQIATGL